MATLLLTWNPDRWAWVNLPEHVKALGRGDEVTERWSTGNRTHIAPGDRIFLLRQGRDPRGIIGSGVATSEVFQDAHWDRERAEAGKPANLVWVRFDRLVDPEQDPTGVFTVEGLRSGELATVNWQTQASGTLVPQKATQALEQLWWQHQGRLVGEYQPEEVRDGSLFYEGAVRTVYVDRFERNSSARKASINHWGTKCVVCGFDFVQVYGERGRGFIEVHHLTPLADIGEHHALDAIRDLRPVCSNCHSMIHRFNPILAPEELQELIRRA